MFDCVVAAGGMARRHGGTRPKSLIDTPLGMSWLAMTVRECVGAGLSNILVAQNRPEWLQQTHESIASSGVGEWCTIRRDRGFASSVLMLRDLLSDLSPQFLFTYGHAPRSRDHLLKLRAAISNHSVVLTGVTESSREELISFGDLWLEPPAMIDRRKVNFTECRNWSDVWQRAGMTGAVEPIEGPGEFNTAAERERFEEVVLPTIARPE